MTCSCVTSCLTSSSCPETSVWQQREKFSLWQIWLSPAGEGEKSSNGSTNFGFTKIHLTKRRIMFQIARSRSFLSARSSRSCCRTANRSLKGISKKMSWTSYKAARNCGASGAHINTKKGGCLLCTERIHRFLPGLALSPAGRGLVLSRSLSSVQLQSQMNG